MEGGRERPTDKQTKIVRHRQMERQERQCTRRVNDRLHIYPLREIVLFKLTHQMDRSTQWLLVSLPKKR